MPTAKTPPPEKAKGLKTCVLKVELSRYTLELSGLTLKLSRLILRLSRLTLELSQQTNFCTGLPNGLRYLRWGGDGEAVQLEK